MSNELEMIKIEVTEEIPKPESSFVDGENGNREKTLGGFEHNIPDRKNFGDGGVPHHSIICVV